ncbi:MAG: Lrp/AsnC family transcriptional regulator [Chloroflexota bacterium]
MLDKTDRQIVQLLQDDSNLSNAALSEKLGLKASTVYERVKKLEKRRVITGYIALVDPEAMGKPILAFVRLVIGSTTDFTKVKEDIAEVCSAEPDVLECHALAGEDDYLLKVRAATTKDLEALIARIRSNTNVLNTVTTIVLSSFKETQKLMPVTGLDLTK